MTTKPKISKSRLALEYLESHPEATVKDVVAALAQYEVKLSDVNNAKQKLRATGPKKRGPKPGKAAKATAAIAAKTPKKRGRKPLNKTAAAKSPKAASKAAMVVSSGSYATIEAGLRFIEATGSIENARELLTLIEQIKKA